MASTHIPPHIEATCIPEFVRPLREEYSASVDDDYSAGVLQGLSRVSTISNNIRTPDEAAQRAELGVQLRQTEVMNTWQPNFEYTVVGMPIGNHGSCNRQQGSSAPGPLQINLINVMHDYWRETGDPLPDPNSIGGIQLSDKFGTLTVLGSISRRTYEGIMVEHSNNFDYPFTEIILNDEDHPCRSEEEDAPPCLTSSPLLKIGTISARKNLIISSQIEPRAVKDNLHTEIKQSILAGSIIDSKELLIVDSSQIINSTVISKHFSMSSFSTASGIRFESNGLFYISGIKRFYTNSVGEGANLDITLRYINPDGEQGEESTHAGLVDSVITQSPSGVMAIHNSICEKVQISSSQFYCKDTTLKDSSITLKVSSGLNTQGIIEQMKVYASPFKVDAPEGAGFNPNGLGIDDKPLRGSSAAVHTSNMSFKAASGHGMGAKYICEDIECPEMFVPAGFFGDYQGGDSFTDSDVSNWYTDYDKCVNLLTQSGCASYSSEYGITEFRQSAARLIGSTKATVEYVESDGSYVPKMDFRGNTTILTAVPNPTYMSILDPQVLEQGIPHAIENSILHDCNIIADADIILSDVTLGGKCQLFFNTNTIVKGDLVIQYGSQLNTDTVRGIGSALSYIKVESGGRLNTNFVREGVNVNNFGKTMIFTDSTYGTNIKNESFGTISWIQPEILLTHQGTTQQGKIIINNGEFKNGGEFIYANAEIQGSRLHTESGSTRQTIVKNTNLSLINLNTLFMHGPNKSYDFLINENAIFKIDNILLKGRSHLIVSNGLVLANNIEVDSLGEGIISLGGTHSAYDVEGKETRPTPGSAAPTRVSASSIKANFINFDQNTIISGSLLVQSGHQRSKMNTSYAYLKISDISLIARPHIPNSSFYGTLGGHVECNNLKLQEYYCGASISGGASVDFERSTNESQLMDGHTSTFSRSINLNEVDNATFSNSSANIGLAANSVFENSFIGGSLSGSIEATNCTDYLKSLGSEVVTYPSHSNVDSSTNALQLLICSADFTNCSFSYNSITDKILRYTFFGTQSQDFYTQVPDGHGGFTSFHEGRRDTPQFFTAVGKSVGEALSFVNEQVNTARLSMPDNANYTWQHDGGTIADGMSEIKINNSRILMSNGTINVADLSIGDNSHLYVNHQFSTDQGSHAVMTFFEPIKVKYLSLIGPNASIRKAVLSTIQVPEKCYLYECKLYDVEVSDKGKTLGCYIKYGKWNGSNAFKWAGQTVDHRIENIDIETGELYQDSNDLPILKQSPTAEDLMGPIDANIQQLRRYTNEAVLTEPRTLEYSSLEYDTEQDITKITMPLSFVDLRNSYNKKIHYKDLIIDSASNNSIGEIIGANASLNQVYISGNIQNNLNNASGIVSSVAAESGTVSVQQHQNALLQKVFESYSGSPEVVNTGSIPVGTSSVLATTRVSPSGYSGYNNLSGIPVSTNVGARFVPISVNPVLQLQGRSGGNRIIRGSVANAKESIKAEAALPPNKTFSSFTGRNQNKQFVPSSFDECKAVVLDQVASKSATSFSISNDQTPILGADLEYSSAKDYIGDGEFNNVNISSHIIGSLTSEQPTQLNQCGGYFTLGSDSEVTYFNFNGSIAWSMSITENTSVTFDGKSYLCGNGMSVPGSLFFKGGSSNNSSLNMPVDGHGLVSFNNSFNNAAINGGTVTFYNSTNWGSLNVNSALLYDSVNLTDITTDPTTTTAIRNLTNLGNISSTNINYYNMNEGITELLVSSTGFSPSGLAGYFKLFSSENPPEDYAALGLYYDSVRYTVKGVEQVGEDHPQAVLQGDQWIVRHPPLDVSAYFEPDSLIAQQFLLPFSGNPYDSLQPSSPIPHIKMEETFFHKQ